MNTQNHSHTPESTKISYFLAQRDSSKWILLFGVLLQILFFIACLLIGDVHVDEAMLMLNARTLAEKGTDILGEQMPIYFDTWLYGGQSPLATYLSALFIKLFGYQLWIGRLPLLLCSFCSLLAMRALLRELLSNQTMENIILLVTAVTPWRLFQSAWVLDCAYLPHMLLIACCFLVKAINGKRPLLYYALSMLFFALGFYAYIAAVFLIPILLIILYIDLLLKKKIRFTHAIWSVFTLAVFSLPFILFGLVQTGFIENCKIAGISISSMEYYIRGDTTTLFGSVSDAGTFFNRLFQNLFGTLGCVLLPDSLFYQSFSNPSLAGNVGVYSYAHTLGGILAFIGLFLLIWSNRKRAKTDTAKSVFSETAIPFIRAFLITFLIYAILVNYNASAAYRYAAFYPVFHILEGLAIYQLLQLKKQKIVQGLLTVCLICSLAMTGGALAQFAAHSNALYGKYFASALQSAEEKGDGSIVFVNSENPYFRERETVLLRFYAYNQIHTFLPMKEELLHRGALSAQNPDGSLLQNIKQDGSWRYDTITMDTELTEKCYLFYGDHPILKQIDETKYTAYKSGHCTTLIRK